MLPKKEQTQVEYSRRVLRVQEYIAHHLAEKLSPVQLSKVANLSPHHFHRVFRGVTGESILEYVRRLKLERAARRLRVTVTDVAAQTRWRKDIKSVRVQLSGDAWTEETTTGTVIDFQVRHQQPNTQFEIQFISRQGFSGTWVGIFVASPSGTMVEFSETIYIQSPILRIISRIFSFPDRLIDTYLMELKAAVEKS
ncbi:AraC family transcriptional regulator [Nodularia sp. UHCC 0506]|uniref:AraC family transcriptional regulator n=1 Tax=Nodularia sp. UHCC 0506 TaxID=3110243 RepID=UPI002B21E6AC|nr:AraC family transcriptional regulator [Nodularia sp. UHCC 0506]MEA5517287.1 AraC family transcriptional regulator [Nodularia sp. UHCC 0506]